MKYTYAYKTSDGVRHEDSMNAASREEVFAELRKRGINRLKCVFSTEQSAGSVVPSGTDGADKGRHAPGSTAFVPASAGLLIASAVVRDLCGTLKES